MEIAVPQVYEAVLDLGARDKGRHPGRVEVGLRLYRRAEKEEERKYAVIPMRPARNCTCGRVVD